MLLRSSSQPLLQSLLPSPAVGGGAAPSPDHVGTTSSLHSLDRYAAADSILPLESSSVAVPLSSVHSRRLSLSDDFHGCSDALNRDDDSECSPWRSSGLGSKVRRARSETDLRTLSGSFGQKSSASQAAAESLVQKGAPITRRRSLSSIPSVFFGVSGLDRDDFILEEDEMSELSSEYGNVSKVEEEEEANDGNVLNIRNGKLGIRRSSSTPTPTLTHTYPLTSFCPDSFINLGDGENYTSTCMGANGSFLVCNSKGCRPLLEEEKVRLLERSVATESGGGVGGNRGGGHSVLPSTGGGSESNFSEVYYKKMLTENPENPLVLSNYARFLSEVKGDYNRAEEYYERAILANPSDGEILAQYAKVIWDNDRDSVRSGSYFEQAVQAAPDNSYVMAAYASFMWDADCNEESEKEQSFHKIVATQSLFDTATPASA